MSRWVDLDDVSGLERAWAELRQLAAVRLADPELREAMLARLESMDPAVAEPIRAELDAWHPALVLDAHLDAFVPEGPTMGYFRRRQALDVAA